MNRIDPDAAPVHGEPPAQAGGAAWHTMTAEAVLAQLDATLHGLSADEAARRLASHGSNEIRGKEGGAAWLILLHQFTSPLIYVLLVAMVVTLVVGHVADAIVIALVLTMNAIVGFTQEYRAENAMRALMGLVSPKATVRRDGERLEIESRDLVPGDIVLLESGDLVPADLRIVDEAHLRTDDSLLTGESLPVRKTASGVEGNGELPLGDRRNMAFMGTAVSSGRAKGVVVGTALKTQIGILAGEVRGTERAQTPLQRRMERFGHRVSFAVVGVSAVAFAVGWMQGVPLVDMFLTAVAISVAAIPEGLPIVMTVALAVSVRRMARRNAIIRRLPAVETLGSCTVIASDKTGTLTENRMTVQSVWAGGERFTVTGAGLDLHGRVLRDGQPVEVEPGTPLYEAILAGMLANESDLRRHVTHEDGRDEPVAQGDPTEVALLVLAAKAGLAREDLLDSWPEVEQIPFEPERQFSATVHRGGEGLVAFVKGAPERVLDMCDRDAEGRELDRGAALDEAHRMAAEGLRVLAMARCDGEAVQSVRRIEPRNLKFLGLVGMMDPPREAAIDAIARCHEAGIRVIMITGDHASTAAAIAHIIGLEGEAADPLRKPEARTGRELEEMSDDELRETLRRVSVYARVSPSQKLRIVTLLRELGEVVAVTGDGVNDAPALKAAHIGAAMGRSGTDVAREASEMVLADDNFATIYAAVEVGRTSFSNIRKATDFLLSTSVGVVIAIFGTFLLAAGGIIPLVEGHVPLLLLPAQILWLNVVTNGIQDVALAFEPGEPEQYTRPPRDPREGLMSRVLVERTILVGLLLAAVALAMFTWQLGRGMSLAYAQAATLTAMVIFKMLHVGACRSETRSIFRKSLFSNRVLFIGATTSLGVHLAAMYLAPMQFLLGLEPLDQTTWVAIMLSAPSVVVLVELHKLVRRPMDQAVARGSRAG